jgi:uncharacterized protein (TIGR00255 family)
MTGFGRGSAATEHGSANVEVAGVNRKQAEVVIQGTRDLAEVEAKIRKVALAHISRGRLQISVQIEPTAGECGGMVLDQGLATQLETVFSELSAHLGRDVRPDASDFIKAPGIIRMDDRGMDPAHAWEMIGPALETALVQFSEMRAREGEQLAADLRARVGLLKSIRAEIGELAPRRPERYREMLHKRLSDLGLELDINDERVQREIGLFADRCDVSEELTRLDAHFVAFAEFLASNEPSGRPLDFLCQELNREFNTIGSKASDAIIAQKVVAAKTELEKIREQVQNVE